MVESFLGRPHWTVVGYPYVWLDGLTQKVSGGRSHRQRLRGGGDGGQWPTGSVTILGMDVGASEDGAFWLAFLRSLTARGLSGVELVTSDAHQGLKNAIAAVFAGASWHTLPHSLHGLTCSPECPSVPNLAWPPWYAPSTSNCLPPRSTAN